MLPSVKLQNINSKKYDNYDTYNVISDINDKDKVKDRFYFITSEMKYYRYNENTKVFESVLEQSEPVGLQELRDKIEDNTTTIEQLGDQIADIEANKLKQGANILILDNNVNLAKQVHIESFITTPELNTGIATVNRLMNVKDLLNVFNDSYEHIKLNGNSIIFEENANVMLKIDKTFMQNIQPKLTNGNNIQIIGNEISTTDNIYTKLMVADDISCNRGMTSNGEINCKNQLNVFTNDKNCVINVDSIFFKEANTIVAIINKETINSITTAVQKSNDAELSLNLVNNRITTLENRQPFFLEESETTISENIHDNTHIVNVRPEIITQIQQNTNSITGIDSRVNGIMTSVDNAINASRLKLEDHEENLNIETNMIPNVLSLKKRVNLETVELYDPLLKLRLYITGSTISFYNEDNILKSTITLHTIRDIQDFITDLNNRLQLVENNSNNFTVSDYLSFENNELSISEVVLSMIQQSNVDIGLLQETILGLNQRIDDLSNNPGGGGGGVTLLSSPSIDVRNLGLNNYTFELSSPYSTIKEDVAQLKFDVANLENTTISNFENLSIRMDTLEGTLNNLISDDIAYLIEEIGRLDAELNAIKNP